VSADPRVKRVTIAEIEPAIVQWMRSGTIPQTSWLVADDRVEILVEDIRSTVGTLPPSSADAILLDVDNGPGYLVYETNAEVYREPFLQSCRAALRAGGVLGHPTTPMRSQPPSVECSAVAVDIPWR
jgi:spermidine synthase